VVDGAGMPCEYPNSKHLGEICCRPDPNVVPQGRIVGATFRSLAVHKYSSRVTVFAHDLKNECLLVKKIHYIAAGIRGSRRSRRKSD
jgi:hypothetical protein